MWPKGTVASFRERNAENFKTRVGVVAGGVFERKPLAGLVAMARYEEGLRAAVRSHTRDKVFVAIMDSNGTRSEQRVLGPGESLILGRHSQATLHHPSEDVSLRHVAIAVAPSSTDLAPLVRAWDLATGRPFATEDGIESRAVSSNGPLFLSLGALYVAIIPLGSIPRLLPLGTKALWDMFPGREHHSLISKGSGARPMPAPEESERGRHVTRVTRLGPPISVLESTIGPIVAMVGLRAEGATRKLLVTQESLRRGLLIGRYDDRCFSPHSSSMKLSRVHLLIAQMGDDVVAIDTASTFGTRRPGGDLLEMTVLRPEDRLQLADDIDLIWLFDDRPKS